MIFRKFLRIPSWPEQFVNGYTQYFGDEAAVFIRGHATAQFNIRENVPRDIALQNLKFCHKRVLRPPLLVTQLGNLPADKIGSVLHNPWCSSYIFLCREMRSTYTNSFSFVVRHDWPVFDGSMKSGRAINWRTWLEMGAEAAEEYGLIEYAGPFHGFMGKSFYVVMRNSPIEPIKNRKKAAHRRHDEEKDGSSSFGRLAW